MLPSWCTFPAHIEVGRLKNHFLIPFSQRTPQGCTIAFSLVSILSIQDSILSANLKLNRAKKIWIPMQVSSVVSHTQCGQVFLWVFQWVFLRVCLLVFLWISKLQINLSYKKRLRAIQWVILGLLVTYVFSPSCFKRHRDEMNTMTYIDSLAEVVHWGRDLIKSEICSISHHILIINSHSGGHMCENSCHLLMKHTLRLNKLSHYCILVVEQYRVCNQLQQKEREFKVCWCRSNH